ncbi:MAG: hypothetical protein KBT20_02985 [Bacteroidales bacterium]|nr:hypothetical protein [Candidatus Liminaster caballi]
MRFLKQYGGVLLILLAVVMLYLIFNVLDLDKGVYNTMLVVCAGVVLLGIVLCVVGGKSADKIGGK